VDKHYDMELPQFATLKYSDFTAPMLNGEELDWREVLQANVGLRNNNFILAAIMTGAVTRVHWVHPKLPCHDCFNEYGDTPQRCGIVSSKGGSSEGGVLQLIHMGAVDRKLPRSPENMQEQSFLICGEDSRHDGRELDEEEEASLKTRATLSKNTVQYEASVDTVVNGDKLRWLDGGYILDIDLDYFIDDQHAPKMAPLYTGEGRIPRDKRYVKMDPYEEESWLSVRMERLVELYKAKSLQVPSDEKLDRELRENLEMAEVEGLFDYVFKVLLGGKEPIEDTSFYNVMDIIAHDLLKLHPPSLNQKSFERDINELKARFQTLPMPCLISICRSNGGGYLSVRDTLHVENTVLAMLHDVFGNPPVHYTATAWNATVYEELQQLLVRATRKSKLAAKY